VNRPPGVPGWRELRPTAVPGRRELPPAAPASASGLAAALAAAAARYRAVELLVVAEPARLALLVPDHPGLAHLLAARCPDLEQVPRPDLFDRPPPVAPAAARLRLDPRWLGPPPGPPTGPPATRLGCALLLHALGPLAAGAEVSVVVSVVVQAAPPPAHPGGWGAGLLLRPPPPGRPAEAVLLAERSRSLRDAALVARIALHARVLAESRPAARAALVAFAAAAGATPGRRRGPGRPTFAVTQAELAALLDPPATGLELLVPAALRLAEPVGADAPLVPLATTPAGAPLGPSASALAGHTYLLGPSGTGKTTLLARLVCGLVQRGVATVVLDPHGDLARQVLRCLPTAALARTDLLDLDDPTRLPTVNPLWLPPAGSPAERAVARAARAAAVTGVFADVWALDRAGAPNLLHFLHAALAALIGAGHASLADLPRFLTDAAYRAEVVRRCADPRVTARWQEFAALPAVERGRTVRAILNKAADFDRNPVLGTVFGDPGPGLDLAAVMDHSRLLVVSLPRGLVPEGTVELLGSVLVTLLHQQALAREARPPHARPLCVAVIDEFQEFALRAFASVVTATRKYGLGLVVANQNLSRVAAISPDVLSTLLANVATLACLRPGASDVAALATQLAPLTPAELLGLPGRGVVWRGAGGGQARTLHLGTALPPLPPQRGDAELAALLGSLRAGVPGRPLLLDRGAPPRRPRW
jgi:hypothetical protein